MPTGCRTNRMLIKKYFYDCLTHQNPTMEAVQRQRSMIKVNSLKQKVVSVIYSPPYFRFSTRETSPLINCLRMFKNCYIRNWLLLYYFEALLVFGEYRAQILRQERNSLPGSLTDIETQNEYLVDFKSLTQYADKDLICDK